MHRRRSLYERSSGILTTYSPTRTVLNAAPHIVLQTDCFQLLLKWKPRCFKGSYLFKVIFIWIWLFIAVYCKIPLCNGRCSEMLLLLYHKVKSKCTQCADFTSCKEVCIFFFTLLNDSFIYCFKTLELVKSCPSQFQVIKWCLCPTRSPKPKDTQFAMI